MPKGLPSFGWVLMGSNEDEMLLNLTNVNGQRAIKVSVSVEFHENLTNIK